MNIKVFPLDKTKTVQWTSGTSTELFIHPSTGSFAERDFIFRISTATVESEVSIFTHFAGITRHLMILKGELELIHVDRYTKTLSVFEQDTFSGEWETKAHGKVTDFNLMLKDGASGKLVHIGLDEEEQAFVKRKADYSFVYIVSGEFIANEEIIGAGNLIQFEGEPNEELELFCKTAGDLIWIEVDL
jgi:environmental stress-induced protein Ves